MSYELLIIGITNNIAARMGQHREAAESSSPTSFAGRYNAYHLIYYEHYTEIKQAILREKELKGWIRQKKIDLINSVNPEWRF